jgi:hypothetical protein
MQLTSTALRHLYSIKAGLPSNKRTWQLFCSTIKLPAHMVDRIGFEPMPSFSKNDDATNSYGIGKLALIE